MQLTRSTVAIKETIKSFQKRTLVALKIHNNSTLWKNSPCVPVDSYVFVAVYISVYILNAPTTLIVPFILLQ